MKIKVYRLKGLRVKSTKDREKKILHSKMHSLLVQRVEIT